MAVHTKRRAKPLRTGELQLSPPYGTLARKSFSHWTSYSKTCIVRVTGSDFRVLARIDPECPIFWRAQIVIAETAVNAPQCDAARGIANGQPGTCLNICGDLGRKCNRRSWVV